MDFIRELWNFLRARKKALVGPDHPSNGCARWYANIGARLCYSTFYLHVVLR